MDMENNTEKVTIQENTEKVEVPPITEESSAPEEKVAVNDISTVKSTEKNNVSDEVKEVEPSVVPDDEIASTLEHKTTLIEVELAEETLEGKKKKKTAKNGKKTATSKTKKSKKVEPPSNTITIEVKKEDVASNDNDFGEEKVAKRQVILKRVLTISFIVLVVGVLLYTFLNDFVFTNEPTATLADMAKVWGECWWYLPCALISLAFCYLLKGLKLSIMCKSITGRWHFWTCINTGVIGHYMNCVTPLAVGGQPFEIMYLSKHGIHGGVASSLPIATFFLNQLAFVLCAVVGIILYATNALGFPAEISIIQNYGTTMWATVTLLASIGIVCCFAVPSLVLIFSIFPSIGASIVAFAMKVGAKLKIVKNPQLSAYKTIKNISHNSRCMKRMITNPVVAVSASLLSIGEQLAMNSIVYFSLKFFGMDLHVASGILEWGMILCISLIFYSAISFVPTPGNSGGAELSFYMLFFMALSQGMAFPSMMLWRVLSFYSFIAIGFFANMAYKKRDKMLLEKTALSPLTEDNPQT